MCAENRMPASRPSQDAIVDPLQLPTLPGEITSSGLAWPSTNSSHPSSKGEESMSTLLSAVPAPEPEPQPPLSQSDITATRSGDTGNRPTSRAGHGQHGHSTKCPRTLRHLHCKTEAHNSKHLRASSPPSLPTPPPQKTRILIPIIVSVIISAGLFISRPASTPSSPTQDSVIIIDTIVWEHEREAVGKRRLLWPPLSLLEACYRILRGFGRRAIGGGPGRSSLTAFIPSRVPALGSRWYVISTCACTLFYQALGAWNS